MGNFYTFALLELFLHCYTLGKKHFARYPWTILPGPNFFYTSTASAASDKYHVCSNDLCSYLFVQPDHFSSHPRKRHFQIVSICQLFFSARADCKKTFPDILRNMASNTQITDNVRGFVLNNNTKSSIDFHQLFQSVISTWYIIMTNQTLQHETCKHANMKLANQRSRFPCKVLIGTVKSRQYLFIILLFFF